MLTRSRGFPRPNQHDDAVVTPRATVLLLSDDAMTLALVGMLVELAGFAPAFAAPGERADDAIRRVRPLLVVLLDDTSAAARSDLFFARAAQRRVALAVFPGKGSSRELLALMGERGIPWFELPVDVENLTHAINSAASTEWWLRGSERRLLPAAERADGGELFFVDRAGRRWKVYDRRGSERRHPLAAEAEAPNGPGGAAPVTRLFVSDDGLEVAAVLGYDEVAALSAHDLERQFLRARPFDSR